MNSKLSRAILALLIGISFPIFTSTQVVSAAPAVSGVLGDSCYEKNIDLSNEKNKYLSGLILEVITEAIPIAGICFPSLNNPTIFIWSKDTNEKPVYTLAPRMIAFGRDCPGTKEKPCLVPKLTTPQDLIDQAFLVKYPDTEWMVNPDGKSGIWRSKTYEDKITKAIYIDPNTTADTEDTAQGGLQGVKDVSSKILLIGLAAFASLSTSSAMPPSQSGPTQNQPSSPEAPELIRARKERRFATTGRFGRFFLGSVISMDRWSFFTLKLPTLIRRVGKISAPAATSIGDADYLRAVLGIFSMLIYPLAIVIGVFQSHNIDPNTNLMPEKNWIIAALILACFDSLAGAISASTFITLTVISNLDNCPQDKWRYIATLIMIFIINTGPSLFAGALRRFDGIHTHRKGKWERLVDYSLSPIVTAWVVWKALELLPKIIYQDEKKWRGSSTWPGEIINIAIIVFVCIFIRYFIEGYVAKHFADRINEIVTESAPLNKWPKIASYIRRGVWVSLIAYILLVRVEKPVPYASIWVLFFLVILPAIFLYFGIKPKEKFAKFNIIGTPRLAILLGTGLALNAIFTDISISSKVWFFICLSFAPILYFNLMEGLTESKFKTPAYFYETRSGRFIYRLSSILLFIFILKIMHDQVCK